MSETLVLEEALRTNNLIDSSKTKVLIIGRGVSSKKLGFVELTETSQKLKT